MLKQQKISRITQEKLYQEAEHHMQPEKSQKQQNTCLVIARMHPHCFMGFVTTHPQKKLLEYLSILTVLFYTRPLKSPIEFSGVYYQLTW